MKFDSSLIKTEENGLFLKPCPKCGSVKVVEDYWPGCRNDFYSIICMNDGCDFIITLKDSSSKPSFQLYHLLGLAWNHLKRDQ